MMRFACALRRHAGRSTPRLSALRRGTKAHDQARRTGVHGSSRLANCTEKIGGAEGNRTPDLCSAIAALSHLSYSPDRFERSMGGPASDARHLGEGSLPCQAASPDLPCFLRERSPATACGHPSPVPNSDASDGRSSGSSDAGSGTRRGIVARRDTVPPPRGGRSPHSRARTQSICIPHGFGGDLGRDA